MAKFNIESSKGKVTDIKGNIDKKKTELADLERRKQDLMDARMEVEGSNMEEGAQKALIDALASAREKISEKGEELSHELDGDASMLEEMAQETDEAKSGTEVQLGSLEHKRSLLDKFGLGGSLDSAVSEASDSIARLDELRASIAETSREVRDLQSQLGHV